MQNPHVAVHGSFSFMVNIDAVTEYAEQALQASVLSMPYHSDSFMVTALVAMEGHRLPEFHVQFEEMKRFGMQSFQTLQWCTLEECRQPLWLSSSACCA